MVSISLLHSKRNSYAPLSTEDPGSSRAQHGFFISKKTSYFGLANQNDRRRSWVPWSKNYGIGTLLNGVFGTLTGSTVSIENVGLVASTRVCSRRVTQISAGFMILFSISGKIGALFASIPLPIFSAIYCALTWLVGSAGLSLMHFTNMNCMRSMFIIGCSIFLGLSIPQYFMDFSLSSGQPPVSTKAGWWNDLLNTVFLSAPVVIFLASVFLDNTLEYRNKARDRDRDRDRGMEWWARFRRYGGDDRSEKFYRLPLIWANISLRHGVASGFSLCSDSSAKLKVRSAMGLSEGVV